MFVSVTSRFRVFLLCVIPVTVALVRVMPKSTSCLSHTKTYSPKTGSRRRVETSPPYVLRWAPSKYLCVYVCVCGGDYIRWVWFGIGKHDQVCKWKRTGWFLTLLPAKQEKWTGWDDFRFSYLYCTLCNALPEFCHAIVSPDILLSPLLRFEVVMLALQAGLTDIMLMLCFCCTLLLKTSWLQCTPTPCYSHHLASRMVCTS